MNINKNVRIHSEHDFGLINDAKSSGRKQWEEIVTTLRDLIVNLANEKAKNGIIV